MSIKENLKHIQSQLPEQVTLVAVSKTKPVSDLMEAYDAGQRIFGENRIQEMAEKYEEMPKDIQWHAIGHVQRNKVKYMAEFVSLIHGVDSLKLLKEINKQAENYDRTISCLLQIKIAEEDSKFGMDAKDAENILSSDAFSKLKNVKIAGVMGMATFTDDDTQIKKEFDRLQSIFEHLATLNPDLKTISMGMSGDYKEAVNLNSTHIRVGTFLFGARNV